MSKLPILFYPQIIAALEWAEWVVVRQRGSHIRREKALPDETLKITVPAHRPDILRHAKNWNNSGGGSMTARSIVLWLKPRNSLHNHKVKP